MHTAVRTTALTGLAALTLLGGTATAASAGDRGDDRDRRGSCTVELDTHNRGRVLEVDVDSRGVRADQAVARVDFDTRRGTSWVRVDLNRRGDGSVDVRVPRRADSVDVTVYIRGDRGRVVTCDASLDLDRRGDRFDV